MNEDEGRRTDLSFQDGLTRQYIKVCFLGSRVEVAVQNRSRGQIHFSPIDRPLFFLKYFPIIII